MLLFHSCIQVRQIGSLNMVSTRNINPSAHYNMITTYSGGSKKELRQTEATSLEDAIDATVRRVPGGEYLMNVKVYAVEKSFAERHYFAVEGDVWGTASTLSYRGFKVGDSVIWKRKGKYLSGKISSLKNDKTCYVNGPEGIVELKYDDISKQ